MIEALNYPIETFLIFLLIVIFLYLFAGRLEPPSRQAKYKFEAYACGEEAPKEKVQQSYDFFHVAFFFTILHVGALLIATAPMGPNLLLGVILIGLMALTAFALFVGGRERA